MELICKHCNQQQQFTVPLWVQVTFTFNQDGTISLLHLQPLESVEEKITDQATDMPGGIVCESCGRLAEIHLNPHESFTRSQTLRRALEDL